MGKEEPGPVQNIFGKCPGFLVWVNKTRTSPETLQKIWLGLGKTQPARAPDFGVAFVSAGRARTRWLKKLGSKFPEFAPPPAGAREAMA